MTKGTRVSQTEQHCCTFVSSRKVDSIQFRRHSSDSAPLDVGLLQLGVHIRGAWRQVVQEPVSM